MSKRVELKALPPDTFMDAPNTNRSHALYLAAGAFFASSIQFPPHDERDILAAEAKRIRHPSGDARVPRPVRHDVEGNCGIRNIVIDRGGMRWCSSVSRVNTASMMPAAERVCPIIDLLDETGILRASSPNTAAVPRYSILSFSDVLVPWALM